MPVATFHPGEVLAQSIRGFDSLRSPPSLIGIPPPMVQFVSGLPFLPIATIDGDRRPWASLLCANDGRTAFVRGRGQGMDGLTIEAGIPLGTPAREMLQCAQARTKAGENQIAMLGIDISNRRRNKFDGWLVGATRRDSSERQERNNAEDWEITVRVGSTLGNCPKYINIRNLIAAPSAPVLLSPLNSTHHPAGVPLPESALRIIRSADLAFLATRHTGSSDNDPHKLGVNCRGGRRGFLRVYWDGERVDEAGAAGGKGRTCVVLPDWSGNRFMQSLGNLALEGDHVAGLTIPSWGLAGRGGTGIPTTVLHLTGETELLAGDEASALMRGVRGAVKIWVTGWTMVQGGMPLGVAMDEALSANSVLEGENEEVDVEKESAKWVAVADAGTGWSPYNPAPRILNFERSTGSAGVPVDSPAAQLIGVRFYTPTVAAFVWSVKSSPLTMNLWKAGRHVVLDMHDLLDKRAQIYQHMSRFQGGEKDLNDDGVRSYTITSVSPLTEDGSWTFTLTLRCANLGAVTPGLFRHALRLLEWREQDARATPSWAPSVPLLGIEGECTLPEDAASRGADAVATLRLAYLASGIGITPLLAHLAELRTRAAGGVRDDGGNQKTEVLAIVAIRAGETRAMVQMVRDALAGTGSGANEDVGGKERRLDVHLHLLAKEDAGVDADADSEYEGGEPQQMLTAHTHLTISIHTNIRLAPDSLSTLPLPVSANEREPAAFKLPNATLCLAEAHAVYLCGAPAFEKVARAALEKAGVASEIVKAENFSF